MLAEIYSNCFFFLNLIFTKQHTELLRKPIFIISGQERCSMIEIKIMCMPIKESTLYLPLCKTAGSRGMKNRFWIINWQLINCSRR